MRQRFPAWSSSIAVAAALLALVAWSSWQRWQLLTGSPFPLGVDGYFYPIQLRSLLAHGKLAYPASPLAFYLLAPFAAATDPITGTKLGAALLGAAIAVPAYGVGARLGGGRGAGLVAAAVATTSLGSTYLTAEFVKNGIGLTVALAALWLALRATDRPSGTRVAAAITGMAFAYATHKMAAAIVVVIAIPAALAAPATRGVLRGRGLAGAVGGLVALAALALAVGAMFPQRFLSAADAKLVHGLWSATPRWTAPALVSPTGELGLGSDALLGIVLGLFGVLALACGVHARSTAPPPPTITAAAWSILLLAIAIGLPFLAVTDRQGLGFRLRIAAFVPAALAAAFVARAAMEPAARAATFVARAVRARQVHPDTVLAAIARYRDAVLAAIAVVLVLVRQPGTWIDGEVVTHPALVSAAQALNGRVPPGVTLIVPERHVAFLVAWYTGAPVAIRPDAIPPAQRYRLLPLHFIGEDSPLDHQLMAARAEVSLIPPLGVHPRHPNGLVLVAEATWEWLLDHLPEADRTHFRAWPTI